MNVRNFIRETFTTKLIWLVAIDSLPIVSLFLPLFFLYSESLQEEIYISAAFFIGICISIIISFSKLRLAKLYSAYPPFLIVCFTIIIINDGRVISYSPLLLVLLGYTFINSLAFQLLEHTLKKVKIISFVTIQINKLLPLVLFYLLLIHSGFAAETAAYYLGINIAVLFISNLVSGIHLLARGSEFEYLSHKLKEISGWNLNDHALEKEITGNGFNLSRELRTICFGDIRGFTAYSEANDIRDVISLLEHTYLIIEEKVKKYAGYKPEFIADEFITYFPDTFSALQFAEETNSAVNDYLEGFQLGMGIGLDRGEVLEGIFGSSLSKKYTVFGRAVNTAARLQSQAGKRQILVSSRIISSCQYELDTLLMPNMELKGISTRQKVYEFRGFVVSAVLANSVHKKRGIMPKFISNLLR